MNVVPGGIGSVTVTPSAGDGPLFVATSVYVTGRPVPYGGGDAVFVIDKSPGPALTAVVVVALLFAAFGSLVPLLTVAVFDIVEPPGVELLTFTVSVIVAEPPAMSVPRLQVTVGPAVHVPCDGVAETKVVFAGSGSETETVLASDGPLLVTVSV